MAILRRLYRTSALFVWFILMTYYGFVSRKGGWEAVATQTRKAKVWGHGLARIFNLRVEVVGDASAVSGLIVGNHLGVLDILAFASVFPLRFAPKREVRRWPFLGWFVDNSRPLWIDRDSKQASRRVMEEMVETLRHNISMVVFPEGTSSDGKSGIKPFKSSMFEASVKGGLPVWPVLIAYDESEGACSWHGEMTLLPHVWDLMGRRGVKATLRVLPPISPEGFDRKAFSVRVHDVMEAEYKRIHTLSKEAGNH